MSGLGGNPNPGPRPTPPPARYMRVSVWREGSGIVQATGSLQLDDPRWPPIQSTPEDGRLRFTLPDSVPYGWGADLKVDTADDSNTMRVILAADVDVTLPALAPAFVPLPALRVRGQFLETVDGQRFTAIGHTDFNLFGRYLDGEDIGPILTQRRDIGFNILRVWTRYDLSQWYIGRCTLADHPDLYDKVPAFLQLCAGYGLYVEFTAYTGREDFDPQHWTRLGTACQGSSNVILELINEADQTGNKLSPPYMAVDADGVDRSNFYQPIPGILCSHGSNGSQAQPVKPYWQYVTFHTNDAPEWWRKNGHNAMEIWNGPSYTNEATRTDKDGNAQHYEDSAAGGALLCAGTLCHTYNGKASRLLGTAVTLPNSSLSPEQAAAELACAQAHVRGTKAVDLACQDGPYTHDASMIAMESQTGDLRDYNRPVPGHSCVVRIRH